MGMNGRDTASPISVIGRAMTVLTSYRATDDGLSLAEITRRTGLAKPTIYRLLGELQAWGMVERTDGVWRLGLQLFELGQMPPRQRGLREAAMPYLNDLHEATRETIHLAILDGADVVYLEKLTRPGGPNLPSRVGGRMPPHCTGVGKALLAHSPDSVLTRIVHDRLQRLTPYTIVGPGLLLKQLSSIRGSGVAYDREESTVGVTCVACPVLDSAGLPAAAISASGWSHQLNSRRLEAAVQATAAGIARLLRETCQQDATSGNVTPQPVKT
jgi:IclR family transcriptional regulator, acetate operon repressor